jgi:arylsulfatase A-like enzyme
LLLLFILLAYEEDIRIPMFVRLPTPKPMEEMTAMRKTTTTTNTLIASPILNIDIAPTLLALVGYAPMTDAPQMDGESMLAKIGFPPSNSKTTTKTKQQQQQQLGALTMSRSFLVEYWPIPATGNDLQHIMKGEDGWCTDDDVKFDPCPAVGTIVDSVNNSWACMRTLTAMPNAAAAAAAAGRPAASVSTNAEPTWKVNDVYCRFFDGTYFTLEDRKRNISNFVEFYDVEKDPYQLNNAVAALSKERKAELDAKLTKLMNCAGVECRLA